MKRVLPEDLSVGCLTNPYNGPRKRVWYLDDLLADIQSEHVTVFWATLPPGKSACCDIERRHIYLSPALFTRGPVRIRFALTHELTHIRDRRTSDDWVLERQWLRYEPILFPEYLAA
jgi:hypothetical protein